MNHALWVVKCRLILANGGWAREAVKWLIVANSNAEISKYSLLEFSFWNSLNRNSSGASSRIMSISQAMITEDGANHLWKGSGDERNLKRSRKDEKISKESEEIQRILEESKGIRSFSSDWGHMWIWNSVSSMSNARWTSSTGIFKRSPSSSFLVRSYCSILVNLQRLSRMLYIAGCKRVHTVWFGISELQSLKPKEYER